MIRVTHRSRRMANVSFFSLIVVGLLTLTIFSAMSIRGYHAFRASAGAAPAAADCGCTAVASTESHIAWTAGAAMAMGVVALILITMRAIVLVYRTRRTLARVQTRALSMRLANILQSNKLQQGVHEITSSFSGAFCAGLIRPKVYVGQEVLKRLADDEVLAVLEHEHYHVRRRDPLRLLLVDVLTFPWRIIPGLGATVKEFRAAIELAADEHAIMAVGGIDALGSALVKFSQPASKSLLVSTFGGMTELRIDQLLGRHVWYRHARFLIVVTFLGVSLALLANTANARVATLSSDARMTSAKLCRNQRIRSCVLPPQASTLPRSSVEFAGTP